MRRLAEAVVLAAALCGGCAAPFGVDLNLRFADDVDDVALSSVAALEFSSDGDERFEQVLVIGRAAQRVERLAYRPGVATRSLTLSVRALDGAQLVIAAGSTGPLELQPDRPTAAAVLLERSVTTMGGDLSAAVDAATTADLMSWDGGPISCPAGAFLCDGFELGDASRWSSTEVLAPATLAVDTMKPFRGSFALDTHMPVAAMSAHAAVEFDFTTPADVVTARAYVLAPTTPGDFAAIVAFYTADGYYSAGTDQNNRWVVTEANGPDHGGSIPMPLDQWNCVELVVDYSGGGNGHVRLYADSSLIVDFVPVKARSAFASLQVGLPRGAGNVDARVFVDEVALAPGAIGCQ